MQTAAVLTLTSLIDCDIRVGPRWDGFEGSGAVGKRASLISARF